MKSHVLCFYNLFLAMLEVFKDKYSISSIHILFLSGILVIC